MEGYKSYRSCKEVWLKVIPKHWSMVRLGSEFIERKQIVNDKEFMPLSVMQEGIFPRLDGVAKSNNGDKRKKVCRGDFVINSRSDRKGSSGISEYTGSVSLINIVLKPLKLNKRYIHNLFRSHAFKEEFYRVGQGIVNDLWTTKYSIMRRIMIPIPPKVEQAQIAQYIDWKSDKVAKFIKGKRKLISLFKEQRQNIINSVISGLNHSVQTKRRGVELSVDIPKRWSLHRLKTLSSINTIQVDPKSSKANDMILIAPNHIESRTGKLLYTEKVSEQGTSSNKYFVKKGQLLYSKIRPELRKVAIAPLDCLCSTSIYSISLDEKIILHKFALIFILSDYFSKYAIECSSGATIPSIARKELGSAWIPIPPLYEQKKIVGYIESENKIIDNKISKAKREIKLIQEYRTSLISYLVTGKIDVSYVGISCKRGALKN